MKILIENCSPTALHSLLILFTLSFISCTSSLRYTSKESSENKSVKDKSYSKLEETYRDYRPIESNTEIASYYADNFNGKKTASGEIYNMYELTAAHINYPFNTILRVTNLSNDRKVIVRINDRKPNTIDRAIDLSLKAAHELKMISSGTAKVKIEVLEWGDR